MDDHARSNRVPRFDSPRFQTAAARIRQSARAERTPDDTATILALDPGSLLKAVRASGSLARVLSKDDRTGELAWMANAVLVWPHLLLTTHWLIPDVESAHECLIELGRDDDVDCKRARFELQPAELFVSDPLLDYTLVALRALSIDGRAHLTQYPACNLPAPGARVAIPKWLNHAGFSRDGSPVLTFAEIEVVDESDEFVLFHTPARAFSTGDPMFDDAWQLVAVHHSGVPARDDDGRILTSGNTPWLPEMGTSAVEWSLGEGLRVDRLVRDLVERGVYNSSRFVQEQTVRAVPPPESPGQVSLKSSSDNSFTVNVPLTFSVRVGEATGLDASSPSSGQRPAELIPGFALPSEGFLNIAPSTELGGPSPAWTPGRFSDEDDRTVELLYATTRRQVDDSDAFFSGERNTETTSYGAAAIRIPEKHEIGQIELPFKLKLFSLTLFEQKLDRRSHFIVQGVQVFPVETWTQLIRESRLDEALVFVHGFNVTFRDALFRMAQITWDLQYRGIPVLFSWAARGHVLDYLYDRESALLARGAFVRLLITLRDSGIRRVNVLAHSMGNLVVLEGLANHEHVNEPLGVGELMMAAPDLDRDHYEQLSPRVRAAAAGLTLYASAADRALGVSKRLAGDIPRAGDVPPTGPIVVEGIDSIDVTAIGGEMFGLGHSVFATTRSILNDVGLLVAKGLRPPNERLREIRGMPEGTNRPVWWRYAP